MSTIASELDLRPGEIVRVRAAGEILGTLDERGRLENLPFMPEMLKYCGQTLTVNKRADKTCGPDHGLRRMRNTVFLTGIRCDGSAHGGCQAACLMYWKEAWLERADSARPIESPDSGQEKAVVDRVLMPATRLQPLRPVGEKDVVWSCQATELRQASTQLHGWHVDQYARDARNWGWPKVLRTLLVEAFNRAQQIMRRHLPEHLLFRGGHTYPFIVASDTTAPPPPAKLGLAPGDRVRIKSKDEIVKTLDATNHMRGLSFDVEMVKYCGRVATVGARVNRLIDEETGRMVQIKSDCILLQEVVCTSDYHRLCPRAIYPYWREDWLERIEPAQNGSTPRAVPDTPVNT